MKRLLPFLLLLLACQEEPPRPVVPLRWPIEDEITLFFCGDIMQHAPQITSAYNPATGDYEYLKTFQYIAPLWTGADFVIANLETTLSNKNFSGYPRFRSPWQLARDLKMAGVTTLVTANNHSCDQGHEGIKETLYYLDSLGIPHTGTFLDSTAYRKGHPLYLEKRGFKIALLNYTYGTNGLPIPQGTVVSLIDTNRIRQEIRQARADSATHLIAFMHWGYEYHSRPNKYQQTLAHWLHAQGVEIIIGAHPHVVQPIRYLTTGTDTTGILAYSIGNFISNQQNPGTQGGIALQLQISRHRNSRYRARYLNHYTIRHHENDKKRYYVLPEGLPDTLFPPAQTAAARAFFARTDTLLSPFPKMMP